MTGAEVVAAAREAINREDRVLTDEQLQALDDKAFDLRPWVQTDNFLIHLLVNEVRRLRELPDRVEEEKAAQAAYESEAYCPTCGTEMELVRPGKHQPLCDCQEDSWP